jgi:hypothetical protein
VIQTENPNNASDPFTLHEENDKEAELRRTRRRKREGTTLVNQYDIVNASNPVFMFIIKGAETRKMRRGNRMHEYSVANNDPLWMVFDFSQDSFLPQLSTTFY